jgi:L-lactate dehydrogenase complex protein LldG
MQRQRFLQNHSARFGKKEKIVEQTENPSREAILARIRTAVATPAPHHSAQSGGSIFLPVTDMLDRFQKECAANNTECIVSASLEAGATSAGRIIASLPPGEMFLQDAPVLRRFAPTWQQGRSLRWSTEGAPREESQVTITLAESLAAATGSVFVSAACGGRGAAVVAQVHIVLANINQLVPDLDAAFARLREQGTVLRNSMLCLITGSSRTADIEKILVMGAHGPRRFIVSLSLDAD